MPVAPARKRRFAIAPESSFETAGAYTNRRGWHSIVVDPGREFVPRDEHLNSFGDILPPVPGVLTAQVSAVHDFCAQTYSEDKDLITAALGEEDAGGALTLGGGINNDSQVTISAGTPGKIIEVTANNGGPAVRFLVPVKSFTPGAPGTAVYAIKLPAGYINVTAVKNLSQLSGGVFNYLMGAAASTFSVEADRAGASGQIPYRLQGGVLTSLLLKYERRKVLQLGATWGMFSKWAEDPGGLATADPSVRTVPFMAYAGDWRLQDLATPVAPVALVIKKVELELCPAIIPELGSRGLDGSFVNLAGSDINGYTRGELVARLKLQVLYPSKTFHSDVTSDVHKQFFGTCYPGKPGKAAAVNRVALWCHDLTLAEEPKLVEADGAEAMDLTYNIGRDPSLSGLSAIHLGIHNT